MRRALLLLLPLACGGAPPATSQPFGEAGGEVHTSSTSSSTTSTSSTTGTSSTSTTETSTSSTSLTPAPDFGDVTPLGCRGKVDLIFAISTLHPYMEPYQARLLEAIPAFGEALETELGDLDLHVLVTQSMAGWWMYDCASQCKSPADCDPNGEPLLCGAQLDACDETLGAGVTFPAWGGTGRRCHLAGGRRYITSEEPSLSEAFQCIANLGSEGDTPVPLDAILGIVGQSLNHPDIDLNGPGGCNEGFLRDDALLVIVIIQNHSDGFSYGDPLQWANGLFAAKGGNKDAVLGLAITTDRDIAPNLCAPGEGADLNLQNPIRRLMEVRLPHGRMASICAPSYAPIFQELVADVGVLCDGFIPQ